MALTTDVPDVAPVARHQVGEIPPIEPHIIEHRMHAVACPQCGQTVRADLPSEASAGYGPRATTVAGVWHGRYRLRMRETSEALDDLFGVPMSTGSVVASCERVSEALEPVYAEITQAVPTQPVVNVDETGWREESPRSWLWAFVTPSPRCS